MIILSLLLVVCFAVAGHWLLSPLFGIFALFSTVGMLLMIAGIMLGGVVLLVAILSGISILLLGAVLVGIGLGMAIFWFPFLLPVSVLLLIVGFVCLLRSRQVKV